ncbi:hypothetical protein CDL15_Pgr026826 [Punica granatum]|uniref:Uncharacterized protein n=1 Tax=Punica granatum TaxID=22663 RepID=A0A218WNZ9_PUNGR|nr:hypothetical protein CDL15_Pgr026826 [Punica granatum]
MLDGDAPVFIVDVAYGRRLVRSLSPIMLCGSNIGCTLKRCALEADGHACLSIGTVALKVYGSFGRFGLRLHRGYLLVGPFPAQV